MLEGMVEDAMNGQPAPVAPQQQPGAGMIARDAPDPAPDDSAKIDRWQSRIKNTKQKREPMFKRMREDEDFAYGKQWPDDTLDLEGDKYVANIVQRHIRQRVAALYAKNPKVTAKRTERMDYAFWDEKPETIQQLQMLSTMSPALQQMWVTLQQDVEKGTIERLQMDRMAKTLELLFNSFLREQHPNFKKQMKQLIRRVETVGVGFMKIDFQRVMEPRPDTETQLNDAAGQVAHVQALQGDKADGEMDDSSAAAADLKDSTAALTQQKEIILREGIIFSFPKSTALIVDDGCRSLEGFLGAEWLAEEFLLSCQDIKEIYKVDVGKGFAKYSPTGEQNVQGSLFSKTDDRFEEIELAAVWLVYDKKSNTRFVLCDGYKGYLQAPAAPDVLIDSFFPYITLMFNEMENSKQIYPPSDCRLLRHIQKEYNRSKEALRQHRIASAPLYATAAGAFDTEDKKNMSGHAPHDVIELNGLDEGEDVNNKFQQVKKHPIDPNTYETQGCFDDMLRTVGSSEEQFGGSTKATATASSIAEDSRISSLASNADDLDEFLSEMARMGGQILFQCMSQDQVKERVGPGAVWPELTAKDVATQIYLTVEAGSSGRPNKAALASALERSQNLLLSIPGVSPRWLFKQTMKAVDETIDLTDAFIDGQPSILTLNRLAATAQTNPMNPVTDPNSQGGAGQNNLAAAPTGDPGPQPGMPGPNSMAPGQQAPQQ